MQALPAVHPQISFVSCCQCRHICCRHICCLSMHMEHVAQQRALIHNQKLDPSTMPSLFGFGVSFAWCVPCIHASSTLSSTQRCPRLDTHDGEHCLKDLSINLCAVRHSSCTQQYRQLWGRLEPGNEPTKLQAASAQPKLPSPAGLQCTWVACTMVWNSTHLCQVRLLIAPQVHRRCTWVLKNGDVPAWGAKNWPKYTCPCSHKQRCGGSSHIKTEADAGQMAAVMAWRGERGEGGQSGEQGLWTGLKFHREGGRGADGCRRLRTRLRVRAGPADS